MATSLDHLPADASAELASADTASADPASADPASATPVALDLHGPLAEVVRRTVEGQLGWQVVDDDPTSLVPARLRLIDAAVSAPSTLPTLLLVDPGDDPVEVARGTAALHPAQILAWPVDGATLAAAAATALARRGDRRDTGAATVRVGGAGGGVGTSIVAAALAGIAGWSGRRSLLASAAEAVVPADSPVLVPSALAALDLWSRASEVPGVGELRAVRIAGPAGDIAPDDHRIEVAVLDQGPADDVDVLVCARDPRALAALTRTTAGAIVVVGDGPVPRRTLLEAVGSRRRVELPWSSRVARAAVAGRVPSALPGRWLRPLLPLVPLARPD